MVIRHDSVNSVTLGMLVHRAQQITTRIFVGSSPSAAFLGTAIWRLDPTESMSGLFVGNRLEELYVTQHHLVMRLFPPSHSAVWILDRRIACAVVIPCGVPDGLAGS